MARSTTGRPGRPREFDAEAVLSCAMDMFWRDGFAHCSIAQVSAATGLSSSSVYNAFGSKHDLYLAVFDRYLDFVDEAMLGPMLHGTQGIADIHGFFERLQATPIDEGRLRGCLAVKAVGEFESKDAAINQRTRRYRENLETAFTAALNRAVAVDDLAPDDVGMLRDALVAIVYAHNLLVNSRPEGGGDATMVRAAHALLARSTHSLMHAQPAG